MRVGAISFAAAALVLVALGVWFAQPQPNPPLPAQPELSPLEQRALAERMATRVNEREQGDPHVRTSVTPTETAAVALRGVRVVDAGDGRPIAGARAFDLQARTECAVAGADGVMRVPAGVGGRVAFAADGYLAKLPDPSDEDGVALAEPAPADQVVDLELRRDTFTLPCSFRFADDKGTPLAEAVRFTIRCRDEPPPMGMSFPTGRLAPGTKVEREVAEAWQRHVVVQQIMNGGSSLHMGMQSHGSVFAPTSSETSVRFIAAGTYLLEAVALGSASAGSREFHVALGDEGPIEVRLRPGRFAHGVVVDARDGQPIAGAQVRLTQPIASPSGMVETSTDGTFRLGPVTAAEALLNVHSRRHLDLEATVAVGEASQLRMTPRETRTVRGVVRQRPALQPIAGVEVVIRSGHEVDVTTKTAADGTFSLQTMAETPEMVVRAPGYLPWLERIDEPQDNYACDLYLADAEARMRAGLTTLIEGRVLGSDGKALVGVPVQLFTDEVIVPEGIAGRGILEGHILPLRPMAITGANGEFSLEWHRPGPVRLVAIDGIASSDDGTPVSLVLGQHLRDIVLRRQQ